EECWFRHDQIGLEFIGNCFAAAYGTGCTRVGIDPGIEGGESEIAVGDVGRVSGFVVPDLEMHGFARADAEKNPQNFQISYFLSQRGVKASATLLDEPKVKTGRARNSLKMIGNSAVRVECGFVIGPWNSRVR